MKFAFGEGLALGHDPDHPHSPLYGHASHRQADRLAAIHRPDHRRHGARAFDDHGDHHGAAVDAVSRCRWASAVPAGLYPVLVCIALIWITACGGTSSGGDSSGHFQFKNTDQVASD
jgi:hypothetical protein